MPPSITARTDVSYIIVSSYFFPDTYDSVSSNHLQPQLKTLKKNCSRRAKKDLAKTVTRGELPSCITKTPA